MDSIKALKELKARTETGKIIHWILKGRDSQPRGIPPNGWPAMAQQELKTHSTEKQT